MRVSLAGRLNGKDLQCDMVCRSISSLDTDDWAVLQSRVLFEV